jgi:hypothetical protein
VNPTLGAVTETGTPPPIVQPTTELPETSPPASDEPTPVPTPTPTPTPTPRPDPSVELLIDGHEFWDSPNDIISLLAVTEFELTLRTRDLDRSACRISYRIVPDVPDGVESSRSLPPLKTQILPAHDETHYFTVTCPSVDGRLTARAAAIVPDYQPELCLGFGAPSGATTTTTVEALTAGMVGRWGGCVETPWTPAHRVDITLRADGTYLANSDEVLDGMEMRALYYPIDDGDPGNQWVVAEVVGGIGRGEIRLVESGYTNVDVLREIKLMGDVLVFEVFNPGTAGPRVYTLLRE